MDGVLIALGGVALVGAYRWHQMALEERQARRAGMVERAAIPPPSPPLAEDILQRRNLLERALRSIQMANMPKEE